MKKTKLERGTWGHRALILLCSGFLTVLLIWFLGYVLRDIGRLPGPVLSEIEQGYVDQELVAQQETLQKENTQLERQVAHQRQTQEILRVSTDASQRTMGQLMELHRLSLEKDVAPTPAEQESLAESEAQFLENQRAYQEANTEIARLSERQRAIEVELAELKERLAPMREEAYHVYQALQDKRSLKVAALRLGVLIPLLFAATWLAVKGRKSPYRPVIYAAFFATLWKTVWVMHAHFPKEYFKYIAICAGVAITLAVLVHLIRLLIRPKRSRVLKQYREAYTKRVCPVCAFPFQQGPLHTLRAGGWTKRRTLFMVQPDAEAQEKPYTCPSCGTEIYETCSACGGVRHALFAHCEHCGAETQSDVEEQSPVADATQV